MRRDDPMFQLFNKAINGGDKVDSQMFNRMPPTWWFEILLILLGFLTLVAIGIGIGWIFVAGVRSLVGV